MQTRASGTGAGEVRKAILPASKSGFAPRASPSRLRLCRPAFRDTPFWRSAWRRAESGLRGRLLLPVDGAAEVAVLPALPLAVVGLAFFFSPAVVFLRGLCWTSVPSGQTRMP